MYWRRKGVRNRLLAVGQVQGMFGHHGTTTAGGWPGQILRALGFGLCGDSEEIERF